MRSLLCVFAFAWFFCLTPNPMFAQGGMDPSLPTGSFEISGQVTAANGRQPAEFVSVRLERAGGLVDQKPTDSKGSFRFSRLMPGNYLISASAPGFKVAPVQVDINKALPRAHVLLQLAPEGETFRKPPSSVGVVNVNVPEKARTEFEKARAALAEKKTEDCILHLERALKLHTNYYDAQSLLGNAFMDQEKWDKASEALVRALEINPNAVPAMVSLGEVYRRQKKYEEGEKVLQNVFVLDDKSWLGHYTLGRIYWERKDLVSAGKQVALTLQLQPEFGDARLLAGNIFVRAHLPQNAIIEYEEYLRIDPRGQFAQEIRDLVQKLKTLVATKKKP
jgi:tetratricopeptide (TPR) repeat protein